MKNLEKILLTFLIFCTELSTISAQNVYNLSFDGNNLHFKTFGQGTPLLIINGGPGMHSEGFIPLAKEFGKNYLAIIYDQRGTGLSKMPKVDSQTITLDKMLDDIEAIRKHLHIEQWAILGHSFGGMLASYYAIKFPNRISGLILSSSGGIDMGLFDSGLSLANRLSQQGRDSLNYWNAKIDQGDTSYYARLQRGKYLAPAYLYKKSFAPIIAQRLTQGNMIINGLVFENMRKINFDCAEKLKTFKKPALIIQGEEDIVGKNIALRAQKALSNSELVFMPECAHYGWLEQPELYFGKIKGFLAKIPH